MIVSIPRVLETGMSGYHNIMIEIISQHSHETTEQIGLGDLLFKND